ncbi:MAG: SpvB/TcaC N-terminal domain-containing protein, partial [Gammaproteobacteria bacterium]
MNGRRRRRRENRPRLVGVAAGFLLTLAGMLPAFPAYASTPVVGTIPGSFGVTPTGAATYSIPIGVPRGSGGLTPTISLVYNSQSGSGAAGWGWTLSGLSAITRCNKTIDDDGVTQAVQLQSTDDYCLDGQRLRTTGTDTYDTELRQYDQITATSGTNGPDHFEVQTKSGTTYEYGNTADSKILATGTSTVRVWALDKVTDANTNYYTITYQNNDTTTGDYWPLTIAYTGNTTAGTSPDHTITFSWTPRSDSTVQTSYLHGTIISQTQLLSTITVSYNSATAFTYALAYNTEIPQSGTGRNQLDSVTECAPSTSGSCFPATTIVWNNGAAGSQTGGQPGWQSDTSTGVSVANAAQAQSAHLMDVNGDGIADLVYVGNNGDWTVMFGQPGGGFGVPEDTGIAANPTYYPYALAINYNGDGRASLLVPEASGAWEVLVATGSETAADIFTAVTATGLSTPGNNSTNSLPIYEGSAWIVDFYGRGLGDFVYTNGTEVYLMQNNGPGSDPRFGTAQPLYSVATSGSGNALFTRSTTQTFMDTPLDFDGSGRGGALAAYETTKTCDIDGCAPPPPVFGYTALLSTQTPLTPTPSAGPAYQANGGVRGVQLTPDPMDANGDGLTDLLYACCTVPDQENTYYFQVELSTGAGFTPVSTTVVDNFIADAVIADYYGDGRQEAIVEPTSGTWDMIRVNYDPPSQTFISQVTSVSAPYPSSYLIGSLRISSIEANGLNDLVYAVQSGSTYLWHYNLHAGGAADLVTTITDGFGNVFEPAYASLNGTSGVYTEGTGATWPVQDLQIPWQVVASYQASNGVGGLYKDTFTYSGAEYETQGHGFLGFASRTVTDSRNSVEISDSYDQVWPWIGSLLQETVTQSSGLSLSNTVNTYASSPASCTPGALCFPYLSQSTGKVYDATSGSKIKTVQTQNTFDGYGDLTNQTVTTTDNTTSATFTTTSVTGYTPDTTTYCIDLPTSVSVTKQSADGSMVRETTSPPAANCAPQSVTVSQGSDTATGVNATATPVTATYAYDDWGNPKTVTVTGTDLASRTTTTDYTTYNGEYPDKVTNALGQVATETWNPALGTQTSMTDANGHTTSFGYDDFGRRTSETRADGTLTNWTEPASTSGGGCPSGVECYAVNASETAGGSTLPLGTEIYDAGGRVIKVKTTLLGGAVNNVSTNYDALGRVVAVSKPFLSGADDQYWTDTSYDVLNRPIQITAPASASAPSGDAKTISYSGFTTTSSATAPNTSGISSEQTVTITDALGEVTSKTDGSRSFEPLDGGTDMAVASTGYIYDPFGDLVSTTDADGHTTSMTYDGLGHKTGMTDPDMGTWSYTPDALGEVLSQTDAKGQVITQGYDVLGRLTSREECTAACSSGTQTVADTWQYDTATNGIGLLASESDSNGFSKSYIYDSLSRPSEVDTTIPGTTTPYAVDTSYDSFSRVATVTYPASVTPLVPVANAVATPTTTQIGSNLTLNGSGSTGPSGLALSYQWSQTAGPATASINTPSGETTTVTTETPGVYTFQLVVTDSGASSLPAAVSVSFELPAPGTPTITQSPEYSGSYTVNWSSVTGATSYEVYQSTNGTTFSALGSVTNPTDPISGRTTGTYYYEVSACANSVCGNLSASSSGVQVILVPASAPTGLTATPTTSTGSFTLTWTGVSGATYYDVYRTGDGTPVAAPSSTTANLTQGNGTDTYYVEACDQAGCGPSSSAVSETVMPLPGVPPSFSSNYTGVAAGGSFTLSWGTSSGTVSYYEINGNSSLEYSASTHSVTLNAPLKDGTYGYYIQACNAAGCSGHSNTVDITVSGTICGKSCSDTVPAPTASTQAEAAVAIPTDTLISGALAVPPSSISSFGMTNFRAVSPVHAALAMRNASTVQETLVRERQILLAAWSRQPSEAVTQAAAIQRARAQLPSLLPSPVGDFQGSPAPAEDLAAWHAWDAAHKRAYPNGPDYAPPEYIAYANAKYEPASSAPNRFEIQYAYDPSSGALTTVEDAQTGFVYWQAATGATAPVDAFGHLLAWTDGNNVSTVMGYDQATGAPVGISTGIGQSSAVQSL